jgi:phosphatidylinositol-3-phosphatase
MRRRVLYVFAGIVVVLAIVTASGLGLYSRANQAKADTGGTPRFQHIFYIMMENQAYDEIIGNSNAPHINALAKQYGLATDYFGVTHDSEPNYVAAVGGSYFAVTNTSSPSNTDDSSDNAYYCSPTSPRPECAGTTGDHQIDAPTIFSQLDAAGLSWKTYQQSIPSVGYQGLNYPAGVVPGAKDKLYAAKHNPVLNFLSYWGPRPISASFTPNAAQQAALDKMVPDTQFTADLASGNVPSFSFIVPDQCHDMHGTASCPGGAALSQEGDAYVGQTVDAIMASSTWQQGNNAIVITWDENDYSNLDCNTSVRVASNGCQVPTIVIANHGPRGVTYDVPANHYSLLLSIEQAFGLSCLEQACASSGSNVQPMTPLIRK